MTLTTKLAATMIALVAITVTAVGLLSYSNLEQVLLPRILDRVESHSRLVAKDLESYVVGARGDTASFRASTALDGMIRSHSAGGIDPIDGISEATWRSRIATRLVAELEAKPAYSQYRIIGVHDGGREVVRVDRAGENGSIRIVPEAELQQKADRDYFKEAVILPIGEIYVSPPDLNQEHGRIETPHVPTVRIATPLPTANGELFGIVIINVDMRLAFDGVRDSASLGGNIYIVNARGDYLVHPDASKEFGSQLGKSIRWQDDFPQLAGKQATEKGLATLVKDQGGRLSGVAISPAILAGDEWLGVIETVSNSVTLAPAEAIRSSSLLVGAVAIFVAGLLAAIIARTLTRPILQLTHSVEGIARGQPIEVPTHASGETGILARAFSKAMEEVRTKTIALEREIQGHRLTEEARNQIAGRERFFSAAVESSNDAIITKLLDGTITGWNPAAERLFGFTSAEAVGKKIDIIVPEERIPEVHDILRRIGAGEKIEHHETVRTHKDGHRVDLSLGISPIRAISGEVVGASKTARDIGESKRAQQDILRARDALSESEHLARQIVETALDAFIQMNGEGQITDWNFQAETIFGWSRKDVLGKNLSEIIIPSIHRASHSNGLAHFLRTGEGPILGRRLEVDAQRRDGKAIKVELSVTALQRRDGVLFNGFIRDLTEKIAAADRLRQAEKMEAVGQLTGGIAHDFNNILTVITGTIEILAEAVDKDPQLSAIAKMIDDAAARGADLTQHLLAFARKQPLQPRDIDINSLVIDTAKLLRPTLGENIDINSVFEEETCLALVDPSQLTTAILNLALNARDAMPNGGKLMLETKAVNLDEGYASAHQDVNPGPYVMVAVSDTGAGIPAAILDKVFDPFFTSKDVGKGTGLGLSMVYGFVKQSSGHVKIYSEEGHGTTVKIYLPPGRESTHPADAPTLTVVEGGNEIILVVEDDTPVRDYVMTQLRSLGYRVLSAANANEAIAILDSTAQIDLLFTDVIMPGAMNGRQLADEAIKRRPLLKVLYTSGYTENAIIHHGRLDAGVLLLAKPYRKSELARMVRKGLEA
jgi:PAS domain S-box-containing protein